MLHQVGVGALGPVFRTYEPTRDRLVAVKVFRLDVTPEQAQALADELSSAAEAGLFHPSVVEPIAAGVEGTVAYRAEEYVAAETLDVALRHYAPAPIDKVLPLVAQLAGAIDFARTSGIGHGALHPRDIFVTPEEARATGFGVVEALERVGLRAPVRRPYSAPERVAGHTWDTPADVFSLAVISYELLTGRRPAGTGSQIGAVDGSTAGHYPGAVRAVFVQAMDDDPGRRYPTALAFASALDAAARGEAPGASASASAAGAAGLAATAPPGDLEEAVEDLPPIEDVDAQAEPVQAEQEEDLFRTEEAEFDDVIAEKGEDEAHVALLREEEAEAAPAGGPLFDEEAVEDLALDQPARAETERFADEFSLAAGQLSTGGTASRNAGEPDEVEEIEDEQEGDREPLEASARYGDDRETAAAYLPGAGAGRVRHDRPASAMLASAINIVLALLVGFGAGYAVGKRSPDTGAAVASEESLGAETGASDSARPYSEETLAPQEPVTPAGEPPVVSESAEPAPAAPAPAAPARETQASTGRLVVRSTPAGANVTMDGRWRGRTPLTLDEVPFGSHAIRVVQSGYAVATENVTLSTGTPARTLSFRLQRSAPAARPPATPPRSQTATPAPARPQKFTGSIYVDSRPRGARVLLDGKPMGTTPVRIPDVRIGSHVVRLQLADHSDWTTSARVVSDQETRVTGSLERIR